MFVGSYAMNTCEHFGKSLLQIRGAVDVLSQFEALKIVTQSESADRYQSIAQLLPVLRRLAAQTMVV